MLEERYLTDKQEELLDDITMLSAETCKTGFDLTEEQTHFISNLLFHTVLRFCAKDYGEDYYRELFNYIVDFDARKCGVEKQ